MEPNYQYRLIYILIYLSCDIYGKVQQREQANASKSLYAEFSHLERLFTLKKDKTMNLYFISRCFLLSRC